MFFTKKEESDEIKKLRKEINLNDSKSFIDKLLQSKEIDKLINKMQDIYHNISEKLFIKFDLKNELKQGKLFTIIIASLILLYLIITTIFFVIMLNSLIGINLVFSLVKYTLFFIKWGYTIIKNKGSVIQKYLSNLFPNNKNLQPKEKVITKLPTFESLILLEIENILNELNNINIDKDSEKEIILSLKNIVTDLKLEEQTFVNEIKTITFKQDICNRLNLINLKIDSISKKSSQEQGFLEIKNNIIDKLEKEELMVDKGFSNFKVKNLRK